MATYARTETTTFHPGTERERTTGQSPEEYELSEQDLEVLRDEEFEFRINADGIATYERVLELADRTVEVTYELLAE